MKYYTDEEIRQILIERKKKAAVKEAIGCVLGWIMLFAGIYIFSMLGCAVGLN